MNTRTTAIFVTALSFLPSLAHAHPGHGSGLAAGLAHPIQGLDHALAMVAVGLWAAQLGGCARWAVPAAFLAVMTLGNAFGMAGVTVPFVEAAIVCSVVLLGLLLLTAARLPLVAGVALVSGFALFHGAAHGSEVPVAASGATYTLGFVLATAALHGIGLGAAAALTRLTKGPWLRFAGAAIAVTGALLAVS